MIYIILNVIWCLILTSNISVNYVRIFLKFNKIIICIKKYYYYYYYNTNNIDYRIYIQFGIVCSCYTYIYNLIVSLFG